MSVKKQTRTRKLRIALLVVIAALSSGATRTGFAQPKASAENPQASAAYGADKPFVVEYYYKTKWGHADEFIALFRKNHYPVLKKEMELGRILEVHGTQPRLHATEDGRWDYRITIVFKNAAIANDSFDSSVITRQLYPDQETYKKEEQRRFEILEAHWDLPIQDLDLNAQ